MEPLSNILELESAVSAIEHYVAQIETLIKLIDKIVDVTEEGNCDI